MAVQRRPHNACKCSELLEKWVFFFIGHELAWPCPRGQHYANLRGALSLFQGYSLHSYPWLQNRRVQNKGSQCLSSQDVWKYKRSMWNCLPTSLQYYKGRNSNEWPHSFLLSLNQHWALSPTPGSITGTEDMVVSSAANNTPIYDTT